MAASEAARFPGGDPVGIRGFRLRQHFLTHDQGTLVSLGSGPRTLSGADWRTFRWSSHADDGATSALLLLHSVLLFFRVFRVFRG